MNGLTKFLDDRLLAVITQGLVKNNFIIGGKSFYSNK